MLLEVTVDSGFLAVIVPATYEGFVDRDWEFHQLLGHFHAQMARRSLLLWGTGLEGFWRVDVRLSPSGIQGYREISGPLHVVGGAVLVTNYESLTMAAQYADVRLPQQHERDQLVELPDGEYVCRVVQMFDPEEAESAGADQPDFVLEFSRSAGTRAWSRIPWFSTNAGAADHEI
jgi:hypothetical protein